MLSCPLPAALATLPPASARMTRSRNNLIIQLSARALSLCLFAIATLWSGHADAQVFAPMCDEDGASAIAPLPVQLPDYGEIAQTPCSPFNFDRATKAPPTDPDPPKSEVQSSARLFIVVDLVPIEVGPPMASRAPAQFVAADTRPPHRSSVYRPPR